MTLEELLGFIRDHRAYNHPIFDDWGRAKPRADVVGALFHHIASLCGCTRPAGRLEAGLTSLDRAHECRIFSNIVASEEDHGPQLATMAAFIVNQAAHEPVFADVRDCDAIERGLRGLSLRYFSTLPGYDRATGWTVHDRRIGAVFGRREQVDREATLRNIGTLLSIEMLANGHIIPGELRCLIESGLYDADLDRPEMSYLLEHAGDDGAEHWHEEKAIEAVGGLLDESSSPLIFDGVRACLDAVCGLWDFLDSTLLQPTVMPS